MTTMSPGLRVRHKEPLDPGQKAFSIDWPLSLAAPSIGAGDGQHQRRPIRWRVDFLKLRPT